MAENPRVSNPEEQQPQEEPLEQSKEERQSNLSPEHILEMSPKEMADLFTDLDENGQLQSFLEQSVDNPALVAQFSYWEKWLEKDQRRLLDETVAKKREAYEGEEDKESLPLHLEKRFTEDELTQFILPNIGAIQLTFGCSRGCPFCGVDAVPGVREHIPYSQLANLFQKYGVYFWDIEPLLYWASEPSDYSSKLELEDKTYKDVHQLAVEYAGYNPFTSSRETNDNQWLKFLNAEGSKARVSVYGYDAKKIEKIRGNLKNEVEIIGENSQHRQGIGLSFSPDKNTEHLISGIACRDGLLLTPRGLYSMAVVPISEKFPQGEVVVPFEKIADKQIEAGDSMEKVLCTATITRPIDAFGVHGAESNPVAACPGIDYGGEGIFSRTCRVEADIRTKTHLYRVWYDEKGIIQRVKELDPEKDARVTPFKPPERQKEEAQEIKKEYSVERDRLTLMTGQLIGKAIENGDVECADSQVSTDDIKIIANKFSEHRYKGFGGGSHFSIEQKIIYWTFEGEIDDYKSVGPIELRLEYHRENGDVGLFINTNRGKVKRAIADGRVEHFTNWTKNQLQRIAKAISETDFSKNEINVEGVGKVSFDVDLDKNGDPVMYVA